ATTSSRKSSFRSGARPRLSRRKSAVTTWIYRIALNTAIKWSRKERKHHNQEELDNVRHIVTESNVQVNDRLEWLYDEIARLNEIDRSVALLTLDDFSYKEIAEIGRASRRVEGRF